MIIKEIELNNFRIYKGRVKVNLLPKEGKNVVIISGKNGYGKTTFLMSLVWGLYGRQMEKVDELYKKEIYDKGNYSKYIGNSLNRQAELEGESNFSVTVTFLDVKIPDISCEEVKIKRSFDVKTTGKDELEILIDGHPNQIIQDLSSNNQDGGEIFIREFILPLEIAKFFLFDAEKIVSLAEANSIEQRRALGKAYSQVLGIHKYEELKEQLQSLQDDYKKKEASPEDQKAFIELENLIKQIQIDIRAKEIEIESHHQIILESRYEIETIQRTLIQAGDYMSAEELNSLKDQEKKLEKQLDQLQQEIKALYDLIPFGLSGETLIAVSKQIADERAMESSRFKKDDVDNKSNQFLNDLEDLKNKEGIFVDTKVRRFYEDKIKELIKKHFYFGLSDLPKDIEIIHDFSDLQINELNAIIQNLKHSFKSEFKRISHAYTNTKTELEARRRQLSQAEKKADDSYISSLRDKKTELENLIKRTESNIDELKQKIWSLENQSKACKQQQRELRKKLDVSEKDRLNNEIVVKELKSLKGFIIRLKEEKKKSLENRIKKTLNTLMHKSDFIHRVEVDISISGDDIEIILFNKVNGQELRLDKGTLSMGERQMYSSALLRALVDESNIDFPVFIDSPMQKFDQEHAQSIIKHFYPSVSNQVVLFPLIHKELTSEEYAHLKQNVSKSYLIQNKTNDSSVFLEVDPEQLINKYDELNVASN